MRDKNPRIVVVLNESVIGSVVRDLVSFSMFAGLMYFNHKYLNGSAWVDMAFILFVFMFVASRSSKVYFNGTTEEAIKWLKEQP